MEHGAEGLYEPLDLEIARCKLMTAGVTGEQPSHRASACSYQVCEYCQALLCLNRNQAEVIKLYGAMELAPLMNLADEIVDIVDTGNTLRANGMEPRELIAHISTRLVVNKAAMTMKHEAYQAASGALGARREKRQAQPST